MRHEHRYLSCEPVSLTAASMGVAAMGAGASIYGQHQQNEAASQVEQQRAEAVDEQIHENRKRATADYLQKVEDEILADSQEKQALAEKQHDLDRNERAAGATAKVTAAESGVAGQTLADIQQDYRYQVEQTKARLGLNQENSSYQHSRMIDAYRTEYENRANAVKPYQKNPVKPTDWFGPLFSVAQAGLNTGIQTGAFVNPLLQKPPATK
ncbi:MAG: hypothetical protein LZF60_140044 [Nitrospira sp.]|nr:MAG: hypothetical protein LZF60_140044 [Nitrospira sp.]